ncbi:signal peptide prediction [Ramlibacter pallidus]|uniref:Signal peptide prediction n=1 Tax=Ramlibacter pallidus TaxID=2780087 RepID=A0ABR9S8L0_9BURK|nr:signal peptide prediction [Ramlibacter pallidus]MBE7369879.1 signal peptide prediction [Ramlibacter pallidus]
MATASRLLRYVWAGPYTAVGLLLGALALLFGGQWRTHGGVMEFFGGRIGAALARLPRSLGFSAMTLGHVILAVDRSALAQLRRHEWVHVRQYERWGPLFVPAYLLSSLLQLLRGRNPYRENHFERQAYALAPARRQGGPRA